MRPRKNLLSAIRALTVVLAMSASTALSGCVLVPFIQAFKEVGATEGDRMALLDKEIKGFNSAVVWGNHTEAASYVAPESQLKIGAQFKDTSEEERIVDTKVANVVWGDGAREATVQIKTKFYRVPVYVVNTRIEEQKWTWSSGSWKIVDRSVREG